VYMHSTDLESPPSTRVCIRIHIAGKLCSDFSSSACSERPCCEECQHLNGSSIAQARFDTTAGGVLRTVTRPTSNLPLLLRASVLA